MPLKTHKKRKTQEKRSLEIDKAAIRTLRTLKDEEAFYFYEAIGKPTGESARSLSDFLQKIKSIKLESLLFHVQRKDFQNWIKDTLGDSKLANRIGRIVPSHEDSLRTEIRTVVENRIKELRGPSVALLVNENLAIASSISML